MAETPNPNPPAVPPPAEGTPPAPDTNAELAQIRRELQEYKVRDGRSRNEKGVMQARIRELEALALSVDGTEPPPQGGYTPTYMPTQGPQYQPTYQPTPPPQDVVTREEWDLDRFRREQPNRFDVVRGIALDSAKVFQFIRYRQGPYGQAIPDVYGTYSAIAQNIELEELRKASQAANPNRNPSLGTISGSGAASSPENIDLTEMSPEDMLKKFPNMFEDWSGGKR